MVASRWPYSPRLHAASISKPTYTEIFGLSALLYGTSREAVPFTVLGRPRRTAVLARDFLVAERMTVPKRVQSGTVEVYHSLAPPRTRNVAVLHLADMDASSGNVAKRPFASFRIGLRSADRVFVARRGRPSAY